MYSVLNRAAPLRKRAVSALAAALLQQQPAALGAAPRPLAAATAWFHSSPAWLGFRETRAAAAAARPEFAVDDGPFFEEEKKAAGAGAGGEGLEVDKLGISPKIVERLAKKGITKLFPIQRAVLEPAMQGRDLVGRAKTGTGKTLAFGIPILDAIIRHNEKYKPGKLPMAIVLAPTRELAKQVEREFLECSSLETICVYGGTPISQQMRKLNYGVDVVIGTPGRVIDLLKRGALSLSEIRFVVLDEADQMLSVGFDQDVETILQRVPPQRQTLMFSATMPTWIRKLTQKYLKNPVTVDLVGEDDQKLAEGISLYSISSENREKPAVLGQLIKEHAKGGKCIVFTQTKRDADRLSHTMGRSFQCEALHGDITQAQRERTLAGFRDGQFNILVATDVAARGLDIPNVDLVIHFELPNSSELFVHRSGRTGRAGKKGTAIVLYNYQQNRSIRVIENDVGCKFTELPKINVEGSDLMGSGFDSFGGGGGFGREGYGGSNHGRSRSFGGRGGFGNSSGRSGGFGGSGGGGGFGRSSGGYGDSGFSRSGGGGDGGFGDSGFGRSSGGFGDSGFGRSGGGSSSGRFGGGLGSSGSGGFGSFGDKNSGRSGGFGNSS
ncbi:DEAD-box ATP-dependent RNA helicase 9-like [Phragmites australis]|uniref:DEAD-box ATP-dependent RNA helicase 9-like n=1 Tax=Phragmites australis TaxID=29695 RepID=UPI002D76AE9D|nr:DEAD-box ATP-dependent RNA helicase 9-like [Phragmites australis]